MNTREIAHQLIDSFSDAQLAQVCVILSSVKGLAGERVSSPAPIPQPLAAQDEPENVSILSLQMPLSAKKPAQATQESIQLEDVAKELGILFE